MFVGTMLAVAGMHRSGTSVIAGMLEEQGVFLGEVNVRNRYNPKGNRENQHIVDLHNDILRHNHSSWRRPPLHAPLYTDDHHRRRDALLADYDRWPCAFKDPRLLVLTDFWQDVDLRLIGVIRNPLSVARSLQSRNAAIPTAECLDLWCTYNRRLFQLHQQREFPVVNFEERDRLGEQVRAALHFYGLTTAGKFGFYEDQIVRHDETDWLVDMHRPDILALWQSLRERSLAP